jgi:hypothetical protein
MHPVGSHLAQACCPRLRHRAQPAELISVRYQAGSPASPIKKTAIPRNHPTPDQQHPGRLPALDMAALANLAPGPADLVRRRQLEKSASWVRP